MDANKTKFRDILGEGEVRPSGLLDQICNSLADAILGGRLLGGERLLETELQKVFLVSRTPIREAFRILEKKGLVQVIPRRGTFVRNVTLEDIEECFSIRSVLEGLAARKAYLRNAPEFHRDVEESFSKLEIAAGRGDASMTQQMVYLFHKTFILASKSKRVIDILRNVPIHFMWKRFVWHYSEKDLESVGERYSVILGLFLDKKSGGERVEKHIKLHVEWAGKKFIRYLERSEKLPVLTGRTHRG